MLKFYEFPSHNKGGFFSLKPSGKMWLSSLLLEKNYTISLELDSTALDCAFCKNCSHYKYTSDVHDELFESLKQSYKDNFNEDDPEPEYNDIKYTDIQEFALDNGYCIDKDEIFDCVRGITTDSPEYLSESTAQISTPKLLFRLNDWVNGMGDKDEEDEHYPVWSIVGFDYPVPYTLSNVYENLDDYECTGKVCWGDLDTPKDHKEAERAFFYESKFNNDLTDWDEDSSLSTYFENWNIEDTDSDEVDLRDFLFNNPNFKLSNSKTVAGFFITDDPYFVTQVKSSNRKAIYSNKALEYTLSAEFILGWVYTLPSTDYYLLQLRGHNFVVSKDFDSDSLIYLGDLSEIL